VRYGCAVQTVKDTVGSLSSKDTQSRLHHSGFADIAKRYMYYEVPRAASAHVLYPSSQVEGARPVELFA
jgi:hypothetical protein